MAAVYDMRVYAYAPINAKPHPGDMWGLGGD